MLILGTGRKYNPFQTSIRLRSALSSFCLIEISDVVYDLPFAAENFGCYHKESFRQRR